MSAMLQRDLPLLLASDRFGRGEEESQPLDRLRMQKGVFLLEMGGPSKWQDLFHFEAYDWGPYSRGLATSVEQMVAEGYLEKVPVLHGRYHSYRTTPVGEDRISELLDTREERFVARVREFVTSKSFAQLLRDVYAAHPEYATRSRFRG